MAPSDANPCPASPVSKGTGPDPCLVLALNAPRISYRISTCLGEGPAVARTFACVVRPGSSSRWSWPRPGRSSNTSADPAQGGQCGIGRRGPHPVQSRLDRQRPLTKGTASAPSSMPPRASPAIIKAVPAGEDRSPERDRLRRSASHRDPEARCRPRAWSTRKRFGRSSRRP